MHDDEWSPQPEPGGALEPPRRNPPTAVGVATPPPPRPRPSYADRPGRRRRRLAAGFVGSLLAVSAVGLATMGSLWPALLSTGLGSVGGVLLYRALRPRTGWRRLGAGGRRFGRPFRFRRPRAA